MDSIKTYKSQLKSHTHLQFARAKNCKRACFTNALIVRFKQERTGYNKV